MERQLREVLEVYKNYTIELIRCLEQENYDLLEGFLNKRQQFLDDISNLSYSKEEVHELVEELELLVYQEKLNDLMIEKKNKVKEIIDRLSQGKKANSMYNKRVYGAKVFSKKI